MQLRSPLWSILLGGMLDMLGMDRLRSLVEELELLDRGRSFQTSGLENLRKASDDSFSQ